MIYGYPGGANRCETSYGIKQKIDIDNPTLVKLRDVRLKYMFAEMKKVRSKIATGQQLYASIANYWNSSTAKAKQSDQIRYLHDQEKENWQDKFQQWASGKPEFQSLMTDWSTAYDQWRPRIPNNVYISMKASSVLHYCLRARAATGGKCHCQKAVRRILKTWSSQEARAAFIKSNKASDQNIVAAVLMILWTWQTPAANRFYDNLKASSGDLKEESTLQTLFAAKHV